MLTGSDVQQRWRLLVFGASGSIGAAVTRRALSRGWSVTGVTRGECPHDDTMQWISWDPLVEAEAPFADGAGFDAVCWAQGQNMADTLATFDPDRHLELYNANVVSVMTSLSALMRADLLRKDGARLVIISSIWQERARDNKLSYTVSKAAVGGLVRSASVDLGREGHLINAVLPGVTDTPMTHANMSFQQVTAVIAKTGHGRLADLDSVANAVLFLASEDNRSITGQSVTVDLGMTNACLF